MWIFLLFMISYIMSTIINYPYGIVGNIKGGIWFGLQIILLYYISSKTSVEKVAKEVRMIYGILVIYTTVCNLVGIIMMFFQYGGVREAGRRFFYILWIYMGKIMGMLYGS